MNLSQKTILITGATSGIGLALTEQLQANNQVIAIGRSEYKLEQLHKQYPSIKCMVLDLSRHDAIANKQQALKSFGPIDIIINNAAIQNTAHFTEQLSDNSANQTSIKLKKISEEIQTNLTSVCQLTACLLTQLISAASHQQPGAVVNINSGLALAPKKQSAVYCATKAAMNHFTLSLRYQLEHHPVKVMQAYLPLVDTAMTFGRGSNKLTCEQAANAIIKGIEDDVLDNAIGKVKWLKRLLRLTPNFAFNMMKNA
ncbi:SDR family NAD(P)-dependent oxidoreductase [Catenovulum sp. SM1970]|uniref:SDR family NAD(P)-dependent oxidoreductase n=1 Tax=Marinifaba aquimaris TaxID=2741323 RepID=UPI001573C0A2|nr:SDR family NAD(P)-dependent oxidoreductase [Marinifaba aquimaris]NTS78259.1 SDR family NAD(P)-dependent oxidoreductase [Marinifaba aquimaris]